MSKVAKFAFIENVLKWEGRFNSKLLMIQFDLSRQSVSKLIRAYKQRHPDNIHYDASLKQFVKAIGFKECYGPNPLNEYFSQSQQIATVSQQLPHLQVEPQPKIVQALLQAIRQQQRLDTTLYQYEQPRF